MFCRKLDEQTELRLTIPYFADELFALTDANRANLKKWLPWLDAVKEVEDTRVFIEGELVRFAEGKGLHASIFYQGNLAGVVAYNQIDATNLSGHIGYWLGAAYRGKGLMSRSVSDLIEIGRQYYELQRIEIRCAVENKASRAIPERLGFTKEGTLKSVEKVYDTWYDHVVYALLLD